MNGAYAVHFKGRVFKSGLAKDKALELVAAFFKRGKSAFVDRTLETEISMTAAAAFQATFADFKIIRGRKQAQFVFECPLEGADAALEALGGVPRPDKEAWVGIARINPKASEPPKDANDAPKERRPFNTLPLSAQAAIRCNEQAFATFILDTTAAMVTGYADCAEWVRRQCGVSTRADIIAGTPAGNRWLLIESAFQAWLREPEHVA